MELLIIDGYVDEPSLLGVPPYVSPEPRMLVGVAIELGLSWSYVTADEYKKGIMPESDIAVVYGGVTVPGNYLSGTPLTSEEAERIADTNAETFLGGPLARYGDVYGYDHYSKKDLSAYLYEWLQNKSSFDRWVNPDERERWLCKGAEVVTEHPMYPDPLLAEIQISRGCPRYIVGGCSFCTEPFYGRPYFRDSKDVSKEIYELYKLGIRYFRLGGQSCIFSYKSYGIGETETPIPNPGEIEKLFKSIWKKCPKIKVLHLDNANPAIIANHRGKSEQIIDILVNKTTAGNVLSLGLESVDPNVIEENNLNSNAKEVKTAVKMINKVGRERGENGLPKLLPGINFIAGLKGETPETYRKNLNFLKKLREEGMWFRRINIRKVLSHTKDFSFNFEKDFKEFKEKVGKEIERPLLRKMLPLGTILRNVYMEKRKNNKTFGRQVGTYPLLVGVNYPLKLGRYYDIAVTDYGFRSITGAEYPLSIKEADFKRLQNLPGIGNKRAAKIFREKPKTEEEFKQIISDEETVNNLIDLISFN